MSLWDACRGPEIDLRDYPCWGSLDLAPVNDLSAFVFVVRCRWCFHVRPYFCLCPSADVTNGVKSSRFLMTIGGMLVTFESVLVTS
ncbi:MAG: hypothetical protein R3C18_17570 [Planctomycetaceae bacterium]